MKASKVLIICLGIAMVSAYGQPFKVNRKLSQDQLRIMEQAIEKVTSEMMDNNLRLKAIDFFVKESSKPNVKRDIGGDLWALAGVNLADKKQVLDFFNRIPKRKKGEIFDEEEKKVLDSMDTAGMKSMEDRVIQELKKKYPLIKDHTKTTISTTHGTSYTGLVYNISETRVRLGSKQFGRTDLDFPSRAKFWAKEREEFLTQKLDEAMQNVREKQHDEIKEKLTEPLSKALLQEGYVLDIFNKRASLSSLDREHWVPIPKALEYIGHKIQNDFLTQFFRQRGYQFFINKNGEWDLKGAKN